MPIEMVGRYRIKDWGEYQHYRDRDPKWIKLHRKLLDNADYFKLSAEAGKSLPLIWLIASEKDGVLPLVEDLAWRLHLPTKRTNAILRELGERGFIEPLSLSEQNASKLLAEPEQNASLEKEREKETEEESETEVVRETNFYVEDFDGDFEFRKLCEAHPSAENGIATQEIWQRTIEREIRADPKKKRGEVAREILEKARLYAVAPKSFEYGLKSWLANGIWSKNPSQWSGTNGKQTGKLAEIRALREANGQAE